MHILEIFANIENYHSIISIIFGFQFDFLLIDDSGLHSNIHKFKKVLNYRYHQYGRRLS